MTNSAAPNKRNKTRRNGKDSAEAVFYPDCLGELFRNAPTLKTEDNKVYWDFLNEVVQCIKPKDIIEWLWLKDVVDLSWEILRFRNLKVILIEIEREDTNETIGWQRDHPDEPLIDSFTGKTITRRPEEIEARKNRQLLDTEADTAELLWQHIDEYEHIERLVTSAELRRDRIFREIELRRAEFARRLRQTTDGIIDARSEHTTIAAE